MRSCMESEVLATNNCAHLCALIWLLAKTSLFTRLITHALGCIFLSSTSLASVAKSADGTFKTTEPIFVAVFV